MRISIARTAAVVGAFILIFAATPASYSAEAPKQNVAAPNPSDDVTVTGKAKRNYSDSDEIGALNTCFSTRYVREFRFLDRQTILAKMEYGKTYKRIRLDKGCPGITELNFQSAAASMFCKSDRISSGGGLNSVTALSPPKGSVAASQPSDAFQDKPTDSVSCTIEDIVTISEAEAKGFIKDNAGQAFQEQGNITKAISNFRQAILLDSSSATPHEHLAFLLHKQGKTDEVLAEYHEAARLEPKRALPHANMCILLQQQNKIGDAMDECRKAIALDPDAAPPHTVMADMLVKQSRIDDAVAEYREAIRVDPKFVAAYDNLGVILFAQGETESAIEAYRTAIKLDKRDPIPHNNLAGVLEQQGMIEEALAESREALRLDPDIGPARYRIGRLAYNRAMAETGRKKTRFLQEACEAFAMASATFTFNQTYANAMRAVDPLLADNGGCGQKALQKADDKRQRNASSDAPFSVVNPNSAVKGR